MRHMMVMGLIRILLIHGWATWIGWGCYWLLHGETLAPLWWALMLVSLIVATGAYMFFNGTEFGTGSKGEQ